MSAQPCFGIGEPVQQVNMFKDHGAQTFVGCRVPLGQHCSFCPEDAVAQQDHDGRTTWVCEDHYVNAVAMVWR